MVAEGFSENSDLGLECGLCCIFSILAEPFVKKNDNHLCQIPELCSWIAYLSSRSYGSCYLLQSQIDKLPTDSSARLSVLGLVKESWWKLSSEVVRDFCFPCVVPLMTHLWSDTSHEFLVLCCPLLYSYRKPTAVCLSSLSLSLIPPSISCQSKERSIHVHFMAFRCRVCQGKDVGPKRGLHHWLNPPSPSGKWSWSCCIVDKEKERERIRPSVPSLHEPPHHTHLQQQRLHI